MILKELALNLDKIFHKSIAAGWDRVGLQIGNEERDIKKILVTLDVDDEVIEEAIGSKAGLVISHHPIIFNPLDSVTGSTYTGRKVMKLVENRISAYAAHSNYDIMDGGLNDILAGKLGLKDIKYIAAYPYEEPAYDIYKIENQLKDMGLGRYGRIEQPIVFREYLKLLKKKLQIIDIGWMDRGTENTGSRLIEKVAVAGGSVNSITEELAGLDCDLVIAGEISYHNAIKISEEGKIIAVIGHGTSEKYAIDGIYDRLVSFFKDNNIDMDVLKSKSGYWIWRYDIG